MKAGMLLEYFMEMGPVAAVGQVTAVHTGTFSSAMGTPPYVMVTAARAPRAIPFARQPDCVL